jgi:hypothetical protein
LTKHHQGKAKREIPIFPELLPHLEGALSELLENFDPKANRLSEQPVITTTATPMPICVRIFVESSAQRI